eukprot:m.22005 g.22005  ORF g.22005 m.22005 type:complete len:154 (+) comp8345_c0_seq1:930-1391(+)
MHTNCALGIYSVQVCLVCVFHACCIPCSICVILCLMCDLGGMLVCTWHVQFPLTALREIMLMSSLDHPNVLCLKEVVRSARKNAHYHVHPLSLSVVVCSMCCRSPRCHVSYTLLACCMIGKGNVAATASTTQPMHALRMGMDVGSFGLQPTAW